MVNDIEQALQKKLKGVDRLPQFPVSIKELTDKQEQKLKSTKLMTEYQKIEQMRQDSKYRALLADRIWQTPVDEVYAPAPAQL